MQKQKSRKQVDADVRAAFDGLRKQQSIDYWLGIIKPKAVELLKPYRATLFVGWNAERKQQITEERCSAVWPHELPKEKPAKVKAGTWKQAQYARNVLHEIACLEHQLSKGEPRGVAVHALRLGAIVEAIGVAPFEHFIEQGIRNTEALTKPQKQKRLAGLADVVQSLPEASSTKAGNCVGKLKDLTGIAERTLWNYLPELRNADEKLINSLAELTSLSSREIRKRISHIPAGK